MFLSIAVCFAVSIFRSFFSQILKWKVTFPRNRVRVAQISDRPRLSILERTLLCRSVQYYFIEKWTIDHYHSALWLKERERLPLSSLFNYINRWLSEIWFCCQSPKKSDRSSSSCPEATGWGDWGDAMFMTTRLQTDRFSVRRTSSSTLCPVMNMSCHPSKFFWGTLFPCVEPSTVHCRMVFARVTLALTTWPNHLSFHFLATAGCHDQQWW